jgi:phosphopantothenoylcysteine synthetase/decarboxylase
MAKILLTGGGTEEPIDGVRTISNFSSGKTSVILAEYFSSQGDEVVLLRNRRAAQPEDLHIRTETYSSFTDLESELERLLSAESFDAVIHLAAVSDFSVDEIVVDGVSYPAGSLDKLSSDSKIDIRLKTNHKIIDRLKGFSKNDQLTVIGFKLTNFTEETLRMERLEKMRSRNTSDFIVLNDLHEIDTNQHKAKIFAADGVLIAETNTKHEMARELFSLCRREK